MAVTCVIKSSKAAAFSAGTPKLAMKVITCGLHFRRFADDVMRRIQPLGGRLDRPPDALADGDFVRAQQLKHLRGVCPDRPRLTVLNERGPFAEELAGDFAV